MAKRTFEITEQVRGEYRAPVAGGLIEIELDPGSFIPKTPAELELAEHLVEIGVATRTQHRGRSKERAK